VVVVAGADPEPAGAGFAGPDPADPYREAVYRAERDALPDGGRRFRRFVELESWVLDVVLGSAWEEMFPAAPLEVVVMRRSRGATFSAARIEPSGEAAAIWIRDGSWDAVTVVHELAHVASGTHPDPTGPHGQRFATALLRLWRELLGVHAYGALRSCLDSQGAPYQRANLG
jgi:putative metallohydrolase (TIGR04338 family)